MRGVDGGGGNDTNGRADPCQVQSGTVRVSGGFAQQCVRPTGYSEGLGQIEPGRRGNSVAPTTKGWGQVGLEVRKGDAAEHADTEGFAQLTVEIIDQRTDASLVRR